MINHRRKNQQVHSKTIHWTVINFRHNKHFSEYSVKLQFSAKIYRPSGSTITTAVCLHMMSSSDKQQHLQVFATPGTKGRGGGLTAQWRHLVDQTRTAAWAIKYNKRPFNFYYSTSALSFDSVISRYFTLHLLFNLQQASFCLPDLFSKTYIDHPQIKTCYVHTGMSRCLIFLLLTCPCPRPCSASKQHPPPGHI